MWLHIRAVGEWTNRLYGYFEREQERLHNGEVAPSMPAICLKALDETSQPCATTTPQKDFLAKNLSRINHHSQMVKSSSFDSPRQLTSEYTDQYTSAEATAIVPTTLRNENELEKKECPFNFEVSSAASVTSSAATPLRPPRQSPGPSKLATENYTASATSTGQRPRMERQISENTALKKLQASLQRTFSRKGQPQTQTHDGYGNESFVGDDDSGYKVGEHPFDVVILYITRLDI